MGNTSFYADGPGEVAQYTPAAPTVGTQPATNTESPSSFYADGPGAASDYTPADPAVAAAASAQAAATSATSASTSATAAANSATAAAASATSASSSASTATTQASDASSSATAAAGSATSAAASATSAANIITNSAVRYDIAQSLTSGQKTQVYTNLTLASSATTDTTNASNISSGTLAAARLPSNINLAGNGAFENNLWIDVRTYGAACNGSTDDTNAIQNAINAAQSVGASVKLFGSSVISSTLTISNNMRLIGDGMSLTTLLPSSSTFSAITVNPGSNVNRTVRLEGFSITYNTISSTGAYAISLGDSAQNLTQCIVRDVGIFNATSGIYCLNCINQIIKDCLIQKYWNIGIWIGNPLAPDSGGAQLHGNVINNNWIFGGGTVTTVSTAIYWESGGGIQIENNDLYAGNIGLQFVMDGQTTEFMFQNNLVVDYATAAIDMTNAGSAGAYIMAEVLFQGNIFDGNNYVLYVPSNGAGGSWITNLGFTDNTISTSSGSSVNQITLYDVNGFVISQNMFNLNGGSARAIYVDSTCANGIIGPNSRTTTTSGSWTATTNNSTSSTVISPT